MSVSYTHLDVYKRQILPDKEVAKGMFFVIEKILINYLSTKSQGNENSNSVSYTHLLVLEITIHCQKLKHKLS